MRAGAARFAAPAAFLLAATVAVLLIRNGLDRGGSSHPSTTAVAPSTNQVTTATTPVPPVRRRYYLIRSGDTLGSVAIRYGVSVSKLLDLNPGIDPAGLTVGQRIRVR